jgi:hypothetical protein
MFRAAITAFLAAAFVCQDARAYHTFEQRIVDGTAYTLRKGDLRLGLFKEQYGILEPLTFGTYFWPWLVRVPNAHLKWRFWFEDPVALAILLGGFRFDTENLSRLDEHAGSAEITVVPLELFASYRFGDDFTLSGSSAYTEVRLSGNLSRDDFEGAAEGAVDNLQLTSSLEWRVSRVTAIVLQGRYLVFQRSRGRGSFAFKPDEFSTIEGYGAAESDALDFKGTGSVVASAVFSWRTFNLRAGLGYGNINLGGVNFILPRKGLVPDFDLYWLF